MTFACEFRDRRWLVDSEQHLHFWKALSEGIWEPETFDLLDVLLSPASTFVDIGTWIGPLSIYAAKSCRQVVSFECDPVALRELRQNIALNRDIVEKIRVQDFALGDADGTLRLHARSLGNSETTIYHQTERDGHVVEMSSFFDVEVRDVLTIFKEENLFSDADNLVKIDVEGSEYRIVPRLREVIKSSKCSWIVSLHEANITRSDIASGPIRAAETIRLLDCFADLTWYDVNLDELGKDDVLEKIMEGDWEGGQTLVFARRKLQPIRSEVSRTKQRPRAARPARPLVAEGGQAHQILAKASRRDNHVDWIDAGLGNWTPFVPIVESCLGKLGGYSATGRYRISGKTLTFSVTIEIHDGGDGSQAIMLELPFGSPVGFHVLWGIEDARSGKPLLGVVYGGIGTTNLKYFDGDYPGVDGARLIIGGTYEIL